jgi:hypothetical protein
MERMELGLRKTLALICIASACVSASILVAQEPEKKPMEGSDGEPRDGSKGVSGPTVRGPVTPDVKKDDFVPSPPKEQWKPGDPVRERRDLRRSGGTPAK